MSIDASRIYGALYQGSAPPTGPRLAQSGFDVLVLAAREVQPPSWKFPGVEVLRLPMDDVPLRLTRAQLADVQALASMIAMRLSHGQKVLVTCRAGLNRSGLLVGATLARELGMRPTDAVRLVRDKRSFLALNNPAFVHAIVTSMKPQS